MKKILLVVLVLVLIGSSVWAVELVRQKNEATVIYYPIVDADGDFVVAATGLDSEIDAWTDGAVPDGFTDCTNEATAVGATGWYRLSLIASEMNTDYVSIQTKTTSAGAKTQAILIRTIVGDPLNLATTTSGKEILTGTDGLPTVNVDEWDDIDVASPTQAGVPIVDVQYYEGENDVDGNMQSEVADALTAYDPPTRAEATTDKNAIITEVDANEAKIDAVDNFVDTEITALVTGKDSVTNAIHDDNKANFKATGFATSGDGDSVIAAITDVNKANFKATNFATSSDGDSVIAAISDVNKANFKATGFATDSDGDSVIAAITDVNKANFKATGFAVKGDPMTFQSDSLKGLMGDVDDIKAKTDKLLFSDDDTLVIDNEVAWVLSGGADLSVEMDSVLSTLYDRTNDTAFVRILNQYALKHLYPDSVTIDNSDAWPLSGAGTSNWSNAQRDSVLKAFEDANKPNLWGKGGGEHQVICSTLTTTDSTGIASVTVSVDDSASSDFKAQLQTTSAGICTLNLNDGAYRFSVSKSTYNPESSPVYRRLSGDSTWNFYLTPPAVTTPSGNYCAAYCFVYDLLTYFKGAKLSARIPQEYGRVTTSTTILTPFEVTATSDDTGYVELPVPYTSEMTSSTGATVKIHFQLTNNVGTVIADTLMEVPDAANKHLWH